VCRPGPAYVKSYVCLSVCLSVRLWHSVRYVFHTGSNTWKIISRLISLRFLLGLTLTYRRSIWSNGNTPKIRVEYTVGGYVRGSYTRTKPAIGLSVTVKRCNRWPKLLWRTNSAYANSMTLDDLWTAIYACKKRWVLRSPAHQKNLNEDRRYRLIRYVTG